MKPLVGEVAGTYISPDTLLHANRLRANGVRNGEAGPNTNQETIVEVRSTNGGDVWSNVRGAGPRSASVS